MGQKAMKSTDEAVLPSPLTSTLLKQEMQAQEQGEVARDRAVLT